MQHDVWELFLPLNSPCYLIKTHSGLCWCLGLSQAPSPHGKWHSLPKGSPHPWSHLTLSLDPLLLPGLIQWSVSRWQGDGPCWSGPQAEDWSALITCIKLQSNRDGCWMTEYVKGWARKIFAEHQILASMISWCLPYVRPHGSLSSPSTCQGNAWGPEGKEV